MVTGSRYGKRGEPCFDEGPEHVLPVLMRSLPGIDPNDIRKTFTTFELISTLSHLVLFVDCSSAVDHYDDLTEVFISVISYEFFLLCLLFRMHFFVRFHIFVTKCC